MKKTFVINGVTGAIGGSTAYFLAKEGAKLILMARDKDKTAAIVEKLRKDTGNSDISAVIADMSSVVSVKKGAKEIRSKTAVIDALVNTAAVYKKTRDVTPEGNETMFATNHLGIFTLTSELLGPLKKSGRARVITVTATSNITPDLSDLNAEKKFSSFMQFGMTKSCNLLFAFKLARELQGTGVSSAAFFPGLVKSGLMKEAPWFMEKLFLLIASPPEKIGSALSLLAAGEQYNDINGKYFGRDLKEIKVKGSIYDTKAQDELWQISLKMTV